MFRKKKKERTEKQPFWVQVESRLFLKQPKPQESTLHFHLHVIMSIWEKNFPSCVDLRIELNTGCGCAF